MSRWKKLLKVASVILLLLSFVLGVRQLTSMATARIALGATLDQRLRLVQELIQRREYPLAWDVLEKTPRGARTTAMRLRLARHWMLDASSLFGRMRLADLAKQLAPVFAPAAASAVASERADYGALIAYAQLVRASDERVSTDFPKLFERAVAECETSSLVHMLYGSYLIYDEGDVDRGLAHFQRAAALERTQPDPAFSVREWEVGSLRAFIRVEQAKGQEPNASGPGWRARVELIRAGNSLRIAGWTASNFIEERDLRQVVDAAYSSLPPAALAEIRHALPPAEHLAFLDWMDLGSTMSARERIYVRALLYEDLGNTDAAAAALQPVRKGSFIFQDYEDLHQRLTGKPLWPLSERDPWAYRGQVLAQAEVGSKDLEDVLRQLSDLMEMHRRGERWFNAEALTAVTSGREGIGKRLGESAALTEIDRQLALYQGELLLAAEKAKEAASVLESLVRELPADHALRGPALVELAAALAASVDGSAGDEALLASSVEHIREAVEEAGWSDWAWIRWRPMLEPLQGRADYTALLERHGRHAGPPAGVELGNGK